MIEYEQGKAIPNNIILAKMERILGQYSYQYNPGQDGEDSRSAFILMYCIYPVYTYSTRLQYVITYTHSFGTETHT